MSTRFTSVRVRTVAIVGLLALLFGLTVWYGALAPAPGLGAYPGAEELAHDYDRYLGERVTLGGRVIATDPVTIDAEYGNRRTIRLTVTEPPPGIEDDDFVHLYGVVQPDRTIRTIDGFAVPRVGHWYTWTISFLAGLWVLGRIVRYWRVDPTDWTLTRRPTPLRIGVVARVRTVLPNRNYGGR